MPLTNLAIGLVLASASMHAPTQTLPRRLTHIMLRGCYIASLILQTATPCVASTHKNAITAIIHVQPTTNWTNFGLWRQLPPAPAAPTHQVLARKPAEAATPTTNKEARMQTAPLDQHTLQNDALPPSPPAPPFPCTSSLRCLMAAYALLLPDRLLAIMVANSPPNAAVSCATKPNPSPCTSCAANPTPNSRPSSVADCVPPLLSILTLYFTPRLLSI